MTMIERVARALAAAAGYDDEEVDGQIAMAFYPDARAAIAAMREPTEAMVDAGGTDIIQSMDNTPDDLARDAYRAMIDAALAEGHAAPIWRKAGDLLAEGDAMIDSAIERAAKPPNKTA